MSTHGSDLKKLEAAVAYLEKNDPEPKDEETHYRELATFQDMLERMNHGQNLLTEKQREWVVDCLKRHDIQWEAPAEMNKDIPKGNPVAPLWDIVRLPKKPPMKRPQ